MSELWERALFPKLVLKSNQVKEPEFDLDSVKGNVKITKKIILKPFETIQVSAQSSVKGHYKLVNVITERLTNNLG